MKERKGAMQLGVSTIVILVIAMVIIGSGISFIRTFFQQGQDRLLDTFPASDVGLNPTSTNPLVLGSNKLTVTQDETKTIQAAVYNTKSQSTDYSMNITDCINSSGSQVSGSNSISMTSPASSVSPSESTAFRAILDAQDASTSGSPYVCNVAAVADGTSEHTKQVTVEVTS